MKGNYIGTYWYNSKALSSLLPKVVFDLTITEINGENIIGTVQDREGGTKGIGKIIGAVKGNRICFEKQMPVFSAIRPDGKHFEEKVPHKPIYYTGELNEYQVYKGTWRIKPGIRFIKGRLYISFGTKGGWEMKLEI